MRGSLINTGPDTSPGACTGSTLSTTSTVPSRSHGRTSPSCASRIRTSASSSPAAPASSCPPAAPTNATSSGAAPARSTAAVIRCHAGPTSSSNARPASVSSTRRLVRSNSGTPTRSSIRLIAWLTRAVDTCSRSAVRPKCSSSASVMKASISCRSSIVNSRFTIVAQVVVVAVDGAADTGGMTETIVRELQDRTEIVDALYRFALGQDRKDAELFASAFSADAELDFRPAAASWGATPPPMHGRDTIVNTILALFDGRVDTTHQITNPRVALDGDTAQLTALVEAQHLLSADHATYALLKNPYVVELVRDGRRWLIHRMRIENAWYRGDPVAIFGR